MIKPYETTIDYRYRCVAKVVGTATWITIDDTVGSYAVDDVRKLQMIPLLPDQVRQVRPNGTEWHVPGLHRVLQELVQECFR